MSFNLGRLFLVSTTATVVGVAAYAIYKSGGVRPAARNTVKGVVKVGNWAESKYSCARNEVSRLVDEAKADMAKGVES